MSTVKQELEEATAIKPNRGEADEAFAERIMDAIAALSDAAWKKLSTEAQAWFNEACDCVNADKPLPKIPSGEEARPARATRRTAEPEAHAPWVPQAGEQVIVTTKRNKVFEGEFIELDGDTAVVKVGDEEMEFTADRVLSMVPVNPPDDSGIKDGTVTVGSDVTLTTKRNAVINGKVLELTEDYVVLDVDGKEAEYDMARVASIELVGGTGNSKDAVPEVGDFVRVVTKRNKELFGQVVEFDGDIMILDQGKFGEAEVDMTTVQIEVTQKKGATAENTGRARREPTSAVPAARTARATTAAPAAPAGKEKKVTAADNGGVSVTARMREMLCADPGITSEALAKQLDKEKLLYKPATMMIVFKEFNKIIELLKANKHYK